MQKEQTTMTDKLNMRAIAVASYYTRTGATIKDTAKHFMLSEHIVSRDLSHGIERADYTLSKKVKKTKKEKRANNAMRANLRLYEMRRTMSKEELERYRFGLLYSDIVNK